MKKLNEIAEEMESMTNHVMELTNMIAEFDELKEFVLGVLAHNEKAKQAREKMAEVQTLLLEVREIKTSIINSINSMNDEPKKHIDHPQTDIERTIEIAQHLTQSIEGLDFITDANFDAYTGGLNTLLIEAVKAADI